MSRKQILKQTLLFARQDRGDAVRRGYQLAVEPLERLDRHRLGEEGEAEFQHIAGRLDEVLQRFEHQNPERVRTHVQEAKKLRNLELLRRSLLWGLVLIALLLLLLKWQVGLVLLLLVIAANIVARRMLRHRIEAVAVSSESLALSTLSELGHPESAEGPATGLAARADALHLSTLTEMEKMTEMQRRQSERQLQGDRMFGTGGFIGTALTTRDRIRQDKNLS